MSRLQNFSRSSQTADSLPLLQLSKEKFNSILPIVLAKQNIPFASNYTIGQGNYAIDLFQLYQTVMVTGHGGEKVSRLLPSIVSEVADPLALLHRSPPNLAGHPSPLLSRFPLLTATPSRKNSPNST